MCVQVYGLVYGDPKPVINGRRGQEQGGVDVFVTHSEHGRIGIQCKKYALTPIAWEHVERDVGLADKANQPITRLLFVTTARADAKLRQKVHLFSDERKKVGRFLVEIDFWDDVCNHVDRFPALQDSYAPNAPGAMFHRQEQHNSKVLELLVKERTTVMQSDALLAARHDSTNALLSIQLDHTLELLKAGKYRDVIEQLAVIGKDFAPFDNHQKARWHMQRGTALWLDQEESFEASEHFIKAYSFYPDDERIAAGYLRGLILQMQLDKASKVATEISERYPLSHQVWLIVANLRMIYGERIDISDVPKHLQTEPDVLMLVALSAQANGDFAEANHFISLAVQHPQAGFHTRATSLRLALEWCTRRPVNAIFGTLPAAATRALATAVALFAPRALRLWSVQSEAVAEVAGHLAYALLIQQRFDDALGLAIQAEAHDVRSPELLRAHVSALAELRRTEELTTLARGRLSEFNAEALVTLGEFAANNGYPDLLQQSLAAAKVLTPEQPETVEILKALRWEAMHRAGSTTDAVGELLAPSAEPLNSLPAMSIAARLFKIAGYALESEALVERAKQRVSDASPELHQLMLADLLYEVEQWSEAASWYVRLAPRGQVSDLQNRLLACYVRGHNRGRAKELLDQLPDDWAEDNRARSLAIELGQQAGDWTFLQPLAEVQIRKAPQRAKSWLFKLGVEFRSGQLATFQNDLHRVPAIVAGDVQSLIELSKLELRYGEAHRGMRRLYRTFRANIGDGEALAGYFLSVVTGPPDLPFMESALHAVAAGTGVTLVDTFGQTFHTIIDPDHVADIAGAQGFESPLSKTALALKGAVVGQAVDVPTDAPGGPRRCTVTSIESAYRRVLHLAQEAAATLTGLPNVKSLPVGSTGDSVKDFAPVLSELQRSGKIARELFDHYARGALTVAGLAALQGRSPVDLVTSWPLDGPSIFVATGTMGERDAALQLLEREDATYVIDSSTIAELVNLEMLEVLALLPRVLVTPQTKLMLQARVTEANNSRKVGTAAEFEGRLAIVEWAESYRRREVEFSGALLDVVERYCTVQPAYGECPSEGQFSGLREALQPEELEMLLLAQSTDATALSMDGRLRHLLYQVAAIPGIFPQALLMHGVRTGAIGLLRSAEITARLYVSNRSFVALRSEDLLWMVMQGGHYLQSGVQRITHSLATGEADFESTVAMLKDFLARLIQWPVQLGAFGELLTHFVEAALRSRSCPVNFLHQIEDYLVALLVSAAGPPHPYPPADQHRVQRLAAQRSVLMVSLATARSRAALAPATRPVRLRVLYCTNVPTLLLDKSDDALQSSHPNG